MMGWRERLLGAVVAMCVAGTALGQTPEEDEQKEAAQRNDRWAEIVKICEADVSSTACQTARLEAVGIVSDALTSLGASGNEADSATVRRYAYANEAVIRVAAAYAMFQLGPEKEDVLALRDLLNDKVPAVRQAARAAYDKSAFRVAMQLRERMGPYDKTEANTYAEDPLPYDPATLGASLPEDAVFLEFERDDIKQGAFLFVTGQTEDAVLTSLASAAGVEPKPLAEVTGWFPAGTLERWANTTYFENVRVVALADGTGANAGKPVRLALVYHDVQMEKTGVALQWVPADQIPLVAPPDKSAEAVAARIASALPADDAILDVLRREPSSRVKEGADPLDTEFWLSALDSGFGVEDYLREFPQGAYRAEAEAYLANSPIVEPVDEQVEPGETFPVRFRNAPFEQNPTITIALPEDSFDTVIGTAGYTRRSKSGEETLIAPPTPGIYEIRLVGQNKVIASTELRVGEPAFGAPATSTPPVPEAAAENAPAPAATDNQTPVAPTPPPTTATQPLPAPAPPPVPAQPDPGAAQADPYAAFPAPTVTLDKTDFAVSETFVVHLKGMPAKADWLSIAGVGDPDNGWTTWKYTGSLAEGDVEMTAPTVPGRYEVRVYFDDPAGGTIVRGRVAFNVQ